MSPPHPSSPTPNRSLSGRVAVRPSSPPGLLTLHKLKLGFYKDPQVLDGPAPWPPVSQAIGRHLQGAGRSSSWRLSGVSPPSFITVAAGTSLADQQAPGSSSHSSPACSGSQINTSTGPPRDATAPLSSADIQPLSWPRHLTRERSTSGSGMRLSFTSSSFRSPVAPPAHRRVPSAVPGSLPNMGFDG